MSSSAHAVPFRGSQNDIRAMPALSGLALGAAIVEFVLTRLLVPHWQGWVTHGTALQWVRLAEFGRNLVVAAGVVALAHGMWGLIHAPVYRARRWGLAVFTVILIPIILWFGWLPSVHAQNVSRVVRLLLTGAGISYVLAVLLAFVGVRHTRFRLHRWIFVMMAVSGMFAFAALVSSLRGVQWALDRETLLNVGELGYLCSLVGWSIWVFTVLSWPSRRIAGGTALAVTAIFGWIVYRTEGQSLNTSFHAISLYAVQHLQLFADWRGWWPLVYLLPLAMSVFAACGCWIASGFRGRAVRGLRVDGVGIRQIGTGIALFAMAGFAPSTPIRWLMLTLSMLLMVRGTVGCTDPATPDPATPDPTTPDPTTPTPQASNQTAV